MGSEEFHELSFHARHYKLVIKIENNSYGKKIMITHMQSEAENSVSSSLSPCQPTKLAVSQPLMIVNVAKSTTNVGTEASDEAFSINGLLDVPDHSTATPAANEQHRPLHHQKRIILPRRVSSTHPLRHQNRIILPKRVSSTHRQIQR